MEHANDGAIHHAVFFVALLDHEGDADAVVDTEHGDVILLSAVIGDRVVENPGFAFAIDLTRNALGGSHTEALEVLFVNTERRRNTEELPALAIMEHDHDLFCLQDHRDALNQSAQSCVRLAQRGLNGLRVLCLRRALIAQA